MKYSGKYIYITYIEIAHAESVLALQLRNKDFFQKYSSRREPSFYTLEGQRMIIWDSIRQREDDRSYSFGIFLKENDELIGKISLTGIVRDPLQSCNLGYCLDQQYNGLGYMTEAIRLITKFGFGLLKLHRIEAGVMPHNHGSMRVLEKSGFYKEGIARKSVEINGVWEDHQMFSLLADDEVANTNDNTRL